MGNDTFRAALAKLSLSDITVDDDGRLVITNPDLAHEIAAAARIDPRRAMADNNYGCCENGALCGKSKIASVEDRLVRSGSKQ